jgi:hypothetical protein
MICEVEGPAVCRVLAHTLGSQYKWIAPLIAVFEEPALSLPKAWGNPHYTDNVKGWASLTGGYPSLGNAIMERGSATFVLTTNKPAE